MPWAREITLAGNHRHTAEDERAWAAGEHFYFAAVEDALALGVIGLERDGDASAWLHYWIRSDRTGLGYATEAAERVLRWGVEQLSLKRFSLWAGVDNRPAAGWPRSWASWTWASCRNRWRVASGSFRLNVTSDRWSPARPSWIS